jgi:Icc protein
MRVVGVGDDEPVEIYYSSARSGGGVETRRLVVQTVFVDALVDGIDAVLLASDLQGVAPSWRAGGATVLLGVALAEALEDVSQGGDIDLLRIGVVLAGDMFSSPDASKRGASGDVTPVWEAFAQRCHWVVGVAGNHDDVVERRLARLRNAHLLDGGVVDLEGLRVGGVSRIIGDPSRRGRRSVEDQLAALSAVVEASPDIIVLHEGPPGVLETQPGTDEVADCLAAYSGLVVSGHVAWSEPFAERGSFHVLNADGRALLLRRALG